MEIVQIAQHVEDLDRAIVFYEELLDAGAPSGLLYLAVDDVQYSVDQLRTRGVAIETEPHVIFQHTDDTLGPAGTDEWMAFITDSEGNTVGLVSYANSDPSD
jgi:methylmalonyl-CoA/ethylmalonyl-CoA epimerase